MDNRHEDDSAKDGSLIIQMTLEYVYRYHVGDKVYSQPPRDEGLLEIRALQKELMKFGELNGAVSKKEYRNYRNLLGPRRHYPDGGIDKTTVATALLIFSTIDGATAFFNLGKDLLLKWMENKTSKSIRLKAGEFEGEIKGSQDIDRAIEILEKLREFYSQKKKSK